MNLVAIIDQYLHEDVMIAFSGGVDSTLLLKMAVEHQRDIIRMSMLLLFKQRFIL